MAEIFTTIKPFAWALVGGVIPSFVWLWFWRQEDRACPEPTGLVVLSFVAGMVVVFFVLPLEKLIVATLPTTIHLVDILFAKLSLITPPDMDIQTFLWAFAEEFAKYATVFFVALHTRDFDEPIDAVIYLITAALGFAAMENSLYILKDMGSGGSTQIFLDGHLRFLGATVLHTASSAVVGIALAFSFYATGWVKFITVTLGLIIATLLHTYFNLSIMEAHGTLSTLLVFARYWGVIMGIIILFEIIKRINKDKKSCTIA
ncbi:MAG: PrsW family intramembrane metalloprotease [Candidatus Yonathbacteria bacterium]|nr:PrsW family intramembrane metalloprotease [Candidatus Yonathbacteria bacterium]